MRQALAILFFASVAHANGSLTITERVVAENVGKVSITLTLRQEAGPNWATCGTVDATATSPSDYIGKANDFLFRGGSGELTFEVRIVDDDLREGDERFMIQCTSGAYIDRPLVAIVIIDDEVPSVSIIERAIVAEGDALDRSIPFSATRARRSRSWTTILRHRGGAARGTNAAVLT